MKQLTEYLLPIPAVLAMGQPGICHDESGDITGTLHAFLSVPTDRSASPVKPCRNRRGRREELRPWTAADHDLLRRIHAEGASNTEMARQLGRSGEAVSNMSRRLGLRRRETARTWSAGELRLLRRMLEDGASLKQIAEVTGHPRSSVADKLRRLNVKSLRFRKPWTDDERQTVLALHAGGASLAEISRAIPERSPDAVQQKLQELVGPAPFRSAQRQHIAATVKAKVEAKAATPVAANTDYKPAARPAAPIVINSTLAASPSPARAAVRTIREKREAAVIITASTDEMIRWLRSRDFMVLTGQSGWQVDRHQLDDESTLLEFVNTRRRRLNLPLFVRPGAPRDHDYADAAD